MLKKMNTKSFFRKESLMDKRAVSPVIGVILMVAITVILAAVIAAFVFGYGAPEEAPIAGMKIVDAEGSTETITIGHTGGDGVVLADTQVVVTPDISTPGTYEDLGTLNAPAAAGELGAAAIFEPGEMSIETSTVGLTAGGTCRVTIIHVPSGRQIFSSTATVTT